MPSCPSAMPFECLSCCMHVEAKTCTARCRLSESAFGALPGNSRMDFMPSKYEKVQIFGMSSYLNSPLTPISEPMTLLPTASLLQGSKLQTGPKVNVEMENPFEKQVLWSDGGFSGKRLRHGKLRYLSRYLRVIECLGSWLKLSFPSSQLLSHSIINFFYVLLKYFRPC
jgi:hypothetical protein